MIKLIYDPSTSTCYSSEISQASSEHIHSQTFLLTENVFIPYSYMELGLYSHFIPLIMCRLKLKECLSGTIPHIDLKVIVRLSLKERKKNNYFLQEQKNLHGRITEGRG